MHKLSKSGTSLGMILKIRNNFSKKLFKKEQTRYCSYETHTPLKQCQHFLSVLITKLIKKVWIKSIKNDFKNVHIHFLFSPQLNS